MRENDISWGTYVDSLATHCNAHPNNFVILPEVSDPFINSLQYQVHEFHVQGESTSHFLAPMDFDMAFTRKTFTQ